MTRDIAAHVRLLEHGLPDQPERAHAYVEMLGHNVYPVVGTRWERVELGDA